MTASAGAVLFDLDGTISDPTEGVVRSLGPAFEQLGYPAPSRDAVRAIIGPPLRRALHELLDTGDADLVERAIALYRERYGSVGLFENDPYPGVADAIATLHARGHPLFVATSKAQPFAERILERFGLAHRFVAIHGPSLDATHEEKSDLVGRLVATHGLDPARTVMIGDREHDAHAAHRNALRAVGVLWGFGDEAELRAAGVRVLCNAAGDLEGAVSRVLAGG